MGFAGNLNTLSLVEVFQTINRIRATGVLRLAAAGSGRDVVFADGEVIGVGFRAGEEKLSLLRRLILEGHLNAETAAAISSSTQDSAVVLEGLVQSGKISETEVLDALHRQAEDELYNICTWDFADFVFQDATPDDPATQRQVEQCRARPMQINVNSLLMEAARRMDEWANLRRVITSEDTVLGQAEGREQELLAASKEYPGAAVVPLIDAVRSIEDIIKGSVATRLDVYSVLADLIKRGMVAVLSRSDILAHADYQFSQREYIKAAQLFRRALVEDANDQVTTAKLADCLELLDEAPEAASCHSQLALGYLDRGAPDDALSSAHRAVRLDSNDPNLRLILVRCLLDSGKNAEAVAELRAVVSRFLELGRLEDARGTCLKILELDPKNEDVRREMARIFATAERDKDNEDVVVCVQCGHVNHREAKACAECEAPLRLSCQSCQRTVAVSDRLCIFCGANPHVAGQKRKMLASPTTTRIVNKGAKQAAGKDGKGSEFWANKIESSVKHARTLEEANDFSGALTEWREIAKVNPDNKELQSHIRALESRVSDDVAERLIDRGHQLRRVRRFYAAMQSYRAAIRVIREGDPRIPRLQEILASTKKHHQRIMVIYATAFIAIGVFGWLVARPYLLLSSFRGDLATADRLLESVPPGTTQATFSAIGQMTEESTKLEAQLKRMGSTDTATEARIAFNEFNGRLVNLRITIAEAALKEIRAAAGNGDVVRAEQLLQHMREPDFRESLGMRLKAVEDEVVEAKRRQSDVAQQRIQAPERLDELKAMEQAGNLAGAIAGYRQLSVIGHETASPAAKDGVARLEPKEQAFLTALGSARSKADVDLGKADTELLALEGAAKAWGRTNDLVAARGDIAKRIQQAAAAFQQLGTNPTVEALQAFIVAHPSAPQVAQAKARLDLMAQAQRSRDEQMGLWRTAMQSGQTEQAWRIARNLFSSGGELPAELQLPIRIETMPPGAQVLLNNAPVGKTPCVIAVRPEQTTHEVRVTMDGWQPAIRKVGEIASDWRWQAAMARSARWQANLGKPVNTAVVLPDGGVLALSGEVLHRFGPDGQPQWRTSIAAVDDLSDLERFRLAHQPVVQPDGSMLLGLPNKDVALISAKGSIDARLASTDLVRGRPLIHSNDLLGGQQRLAYAADALYIGDLGQQMSRIPLPSPALGGPLSFAKGPDRVLVVATIQGQLLAFEESTKQRLWQFDLKATEIGQLIPLGTDAAFALLDGSRLASWGISPTGATLRWNTALPGPAVGEPALSPQGIWIAAGNALVRLSQDGVASNLPLPAAAITPAAAGGELAAVGVRSGQVLVYRRGTLLWMTSCPMPPTAVACSSDMVVVGLSDGTLATYSP
jgi:tetratricopeptide (TPR) repeat protein